MSKSQKRFEDWDNVDCNQCQRYYDNSCDGVQKGSKKACNSYLATREVVIPSEIKRLKRAFKCAVCVIAAVWLIVFVLLLHCLGVW